jgi:mannose-6-phosphate isomerase-like protein (cupin superfamily)
VSEATVSSYTQKNLADVDDSAPKFGFEDVQIARFANDDLKTQGTGLSYHSVKAGKRQAFAHKHDQAEEVYVVLAGSGRLKLDDEIIDVAELDAIRIAPGVTRQFEAGDKQLDYLAFGPHHEGDGDLVKDWWTD